MSDYRESIRKERPLDEQLPIYQPDIIVLPTAEEVDQCAADTIIQQIRSKPDSILTLPTGSTPKGVYQLLVDAYRTTNLDFSQLTIFNLDEYWPIPHQHPSSYAYYMMENLYRHVNVNPSNIHIPRGDAPDAHIEAQRYEELLKQHSPVDLAVLGIGPGTTCHIGFNEKGSELNSRVRCMPLDVETRQTNSAFFTNPNELPEGAITQGIANILEAQNIVLIAKGPAKAWGIHRALTGEINADAPASFLRNHPNVTVILDQEAAQLLE